MKKTAVGLAFYSLKVHHLNGREFKKLDKLDKPHTSFLEEIRKALLACPTYEEAKPLLNVKKKVYGVSKVGKISEGQLSGIVACGETGRTANIHNEEGELAHKQKYTDYVVGPYYYLFDVQPGTDTAIIAIQTFGLHGIKTLFLSDIIEHLRQIYKKMGYYIHFDSLAVGHLFIDKYLANGEVKRVTVTRYKDAADRASSRVKKIKTEISISPVGRNGTLKNILKMWADKRKVEPSNAKVSEFMLQQIPQFYGIDADGFNDASFSVVLDGKPRKIDLKDIDGFASRFDISEEVERDKEGHPKFNSIDHTAKQVLAKVAKKIRG